MSYKIPYVDMSRLSEDERIDVIGNFVMEGRVATWCLTDDEPGKPERYRTKLHTRFPLLILGTEIKRSFPTKGVAGFTVNPPAYS